MFITQIKDCYVYVVPAEDRWRYIVEPLSSSFVPGHISEIVYDDKQQAYIASTEFILRKIYTTAG